MKRFISIISIILFSVTVFAAGKIQNEDVKSLTELTGAGGTVAQLINTTKIYDVTNSMQLSASIAGGLLGGGGGGALVWREDGNSPIGSLDSVNNRIYSYQSALSQSLYTVVKAPHTYGGGTQIKMYLLFYSSDSTGTIQMQTVASLVRKANDLFSSVTNQRTSTNAAFSTGAGTVNKPQLVTFDLTDSTGQINGVSVSADDLIRVTLTRSSDTATSDVQVLTDTAEIATH